MIILVKRHHTLKFKSPYLPFGNGPFYALRVAPNVKAFFDRLVFITSQKKFDLGRSPYIGQMGPYQTQEKNI